MTTRDAHEPADKPSPRRARAWTPPEHLQALSPPGDFAQRCEEIGVALDESDTRALGLYLALLYEANAAFNLTAIKDQGEAWERHILDSLTLMQVLAELPEGASVADIGSGGGAPAIPLAIAMPHLRFTLIESTGKKAEFLRTVADTLGLSNVRVLAERAEVVGTHPSPHRAAFDAVTARAVGRVAVIAELCVPLAKVGGLVALIKGQRADEELEEAKQAMHMLHAGVVGVVDTPTGRIVVLEKRRTTPRDYPRRPGEPKRAPLGT